MYYDTRYHQAYCYFDSDKTYRVKLPQNLDGFAKLPVSDQQVLLDKYSPGTIATPKAAKHLCGYCGVIIKEAFE